MKRNAFFCWMLAVALLWVSGCSHLHVDLNSSWRIAADAQVFVEVEQPPGEVSDEQIKKRISQLGWTVVDSATASDARLVCRWQRAIDLTDDSELTTKIKSFHAKLLATNDDRVLGVADYFYGTGEMELWPGVEQALQSLYQRLTLPVAVETVPQVAPVAPSPVQQPGAVPEAPVATEATAVPPVAQPSVSAPVEAASSDTETVTHEAAVVILSDAPSQRRQSEVKPVSMAPAANAVAQESAIVQIQERPAAIQQVAPESDDPQRLVEPETLEVSPWVPRFQGFGLDTWGQEEVDEE